MDARNFLGALWRRHENEERDEAPPNAASTRAPESSRGGSHLTPMAAARALPKPALRWVGEAGRIALRNFDFSADAATVSSWQQETYSENFAEFHYTESFADAFRYDLRRAALDANHALFVLDGGGALCGFLWLVLCENNWTSERYGYVNNIYVTAENRGQGLGKTLMQQAESWFAYRRVKSVRLTVTASNEAACRLYQSCGYAISRHEMDKEIE